jgi:arylsulfatase A-like enzyme
MARQLEMTQDEFLLAQSWYAGALAYLDFRLGELFQYLKELGAYDNTLIIVTADHGENFGEHHLAYHLFCLYDTLLHVPLIMSCPTLLPRGQKVSGLVSLVDVVPTIVELLGIEKGTDPLHGQSLLPMDGQTNYHEHIFAEFGRPHAMIERLAARFPGHDFSAFDRGLQSIRTPEYKFIAGSDNSGELYALREDPGETHNRVDEFTDVAADLRAKLDTWRASIGVTYQGQQGQEDAAIVKALEQLGYF